MYLYSEKICLQFNQYNDSDSNPVPAKIQIQPCSPAVWDWIEMRMNEMDTICYAVMCCNVWKFFHLLKIRKHFLPVLDAKSNFSAFVLYCERKSVAIFISPLFEIENLTCFTDDKFPLVWNRNKSLDTFKVHCKKLFL